MEVIATSDCSALQNTQFFFYGFFSGAQISTLQSSINDIATQETMQ
jgi:hypothetical protein